MALVCLDSDRWVVGVARGIAGATGYDSSIVRLAFALLTVCAGSGLLIYFILWAIMSRPTGGSLAKDGLREVNRWRRERHR